jgi:hypothetical protein
MKQKRTMMKSTIQAAKVSTVQANHEVMLLWVMFMKMHIRVERKRKRIGPKRNGGSSRRSGGTEVRSLFDAWRIGQRRRAGKEACDVCSSSFTSFQGSGLQEFSNQEEQAQALCEKYAFHIAIKAFLEELTSLSSYFNRQKYHFIKCGCIRKIKDDHDHADEYLLDVALMINKKQYALYKELINRRHNRSCGYNLLIGNDKSTGYSMDLCMNSLLNLIEIGPKRFTNLSMTIFLPDKNKHNNYGNIYCALAQDVFDSVLMFIWDKGATERDVYATRVIRYLTKTELRDEEIGAVNLPSNTTKRDMYELFCFNRGWTAKSDNKGRYPKVVDYKRRKLDDIFWQAYTESFEVCSWWSFRNIWKEHCYNIRIRIPCNDTYGDCTIFLNAFRYCSSQVGNVDDNVSDGEPVSEVKPASDDKYFWNGDSIL